MDRAIRSNRILLYIGGVTLGLSVVAGFLMHWIDRDAFPTVGTGVWWAVVTFSTVGYGDVVPTDPLGRTVASVVMVFAITFIAILTALVTSALVTAEQRRQEAARGADDALSRALERIERRLETIESRLP